MTFKIERDVPIPPVYKGPSHGKNHYPWKLMTPGDSVFIPGLSLGRVSSLLNHHSNKHPPAKFVCRSLDGGTRVWRVE